ncbi:MAG: cation:proton antiporter [Prevotellaceae bacterium]|nr:cation:proton antiporter [Prevotellaceae bacterium]
MMLLDALPATMSTALITDPTWIFSVVLGIILLAPLLLRQLRIPPVIGLIMAGMLVGQYGLNLLAHDSSFSLFGQVGIYYIMFLAGLGLEMGSVEQHGHNGLRFGLLTFVIPFFLGIATSVWLLGYKLSSAILLSCIYASHTLIAYPIVGRYGLSRHRVVVVSVVATAFALFAALLVLAVLVGSQNSGATWLTWLFFGLRCVLYVVFVVIAFPRIGRWFLRRYQDSVMQYIFVLTLVFISASLAKMVGLDGLLGAFLAGLLVNRLIPKTSPLMSRLEFVGNALFIPYFLIGVGMIIDLGILVRHPDTLWAVAVIVLTGTLSKLLASGLMVWTMRESRHSMWLMFGLTNAHAAGALAIVSIGTNPKVGLMSDEVLGGTVMLILFSCILSSFAANRGAKELALSDISLEDNRGSYHGKCLVTYSQEANVNVLTQLAILIRNPFIPDSLMGLYVAYEDASPDPAKQGGKGGVEKGRRLLENAQMIAAAADVPMATLSRMSTNIAGGILHTMNEYDCGEVIVCLADRTTGMPRSSLGTVIDSVLSGSHREVMAVRSIVPPGTIRRVIVAVPQKAEYEVGFYKWLEHICRIGEELDCHLEYHAHADTLPYIRGYMEQKHSHVRSQYAEMNRWMQFLNLRHEVDLSCMFVAVTARSGFISYQDSFEELPLLIHRYFSDTNVMLLFPDQWGEPHESIVVFTPNGTAVQRQPRSIGGWIRRLLFTTRRTAMLLCFLLAPFFLHYIAAQRPRYDKMSPLVRLKALTSNPSPGKRGDDAPFLAKDVSFSGKDAFSSEQSTSSFVKDSRRLLTLIQSDSEEALSEHACHVYARWGNIYAAAVPVTELEALSLCPEVTRIECGRVCEALTDTAAIITHSIALRTPAAHRPAYTGQGVVVGVMDIGFDLTNPSYYSRDMESYRVRSFWDMLDYSVSPEGGERVVNGLELPVGAAYTTTESILRKACSSDSHLQYHGSHTSTTAAGSGYDSPYIGMAPDADICLVSNCVSSDMELVPDSLQDFYGVVADLLGFDYIFRYADSVGKPCVISFSEGSHEDLWGEAQLYGMVLDSLVRPGRIICAAAGNQSVYGTYMHKPAGQERAASLIQPSGNLTYMLLRSRGDFSVCLDFMASGDVLLSHEVSLSDILVMEDSLLVDTITAGDLTFQLMYSTYPCCYDPAQLVTDVVITKIGKGLLTSIQMGISVVGSGTEVEVYQGVGYLQSKPDYPDYQDAESTHNIHFPGSVPSVVCVGSTSYRTGFLTYEGIWRTVDWGTGGEVAGYSSRGPTMAGNVKPDVLAPGTNVVAAFNSFYAESNPQDYVATLDVVRYKFNGRTYGWNMQNGTSMACPVVAGIIAQWLEAIPTLTREQIIEAFGATCKRHDPLLTYPNNDYGYGEIDAEAGLEYLLAHYDGVVPVPASGSERVYDLNGREVTQPSHGIYIMLGTDGSRRKVLFE